MNILSEIPFVQVLLSGRGKLVAEIAFRERDAQVVVASCDNWHLDEFREAIYANAQRSCKKGS